jgi:hypothetical protein
MNDQPLTGPLKRLLLLVGLALGAGLVLLRLYRYIVGRLLGLTLPLYHTKVIPSLRVPMPDGIPLATDLYSPTQAGSYPTILIRCPYGRNRHAGAVGVLMAFLARRFAERGYHVVLQDVRGRFDSPGVFDPYFNEKQDGLATLDWLARQPWFNGKVGLWGPSYLGIAQWAIAADSPLIQAMMPITTGSRLYDILYPDGALDLALVMRWMALFQALDRNRGKPLLLSLPIFHQVEKAVAPAFRHLPVQEADTVVVGDEVPFYRKWLAHDDPMAPLWQEVRQDMKVDQVKAPVHLVGGWYDFFLRATLHDYATLKAAGQTPYLTIGSWSHFSRAMVTLDALREGLAWFDAHLKGQQRRLRAKPVRLFVMGLNRWREMDEWPPPCQETRYYLHDKHRLNTRPPQDDLETDHYCYDPADPTPYAGGAEFSVWAGPRDNRELEARPDVLKYTTAALHQAVEVIGPVCLELYVRSSLDYTDFFGRVCDVYPDGRSINVCDGLFRVLPGKGEPQPDGSLRIELDLWATAYRFQSGHRIRLLVASGAHPRWMRNLGTGQQFGAEMKVAEQTVYHDSLHPSALVLPVI